MPVADPPDALDQQQALIPSDALATAQDTVRLERDSGGAALRPPHIRRGVDIQPPEQGRAWIPALALRGALRVAGMSFFR